MSGLRHFAKQPSSIARVCAGLVVDCDSHSLSFQLRTNLDSPNASKCHSSYDLQDRYHEISPGIMKQKRMVRSVQHCDSPYPRRHFAHLTACLRNVDRPSPRCCGWLVVYAFWGPRAPLGVPVWKPFLKRREMVERDRMRPVPVVFLRLAFSDQLSVLPRCQHPALILLLRRWCLRSMVG